MRSGRKSVRHSMILEVPPNARSSGGTLRLLCCQRTAISLNARHFRSHEAGICVDFVAGNPRQRNRSQTGVASPEGQAIRRGPERMAKDPSFSSVGVDKV
jgi:hypothetical protein